MPMDGKSINQNNNQYDQQNKQQNDQQYNQQNNHKNDNQPEGKTESVEYGAGEQQVTGKAIQSPHDKLFKSYLEHKQALHAFLSLTVEKEVLDLCSLESVTLMQNSFIDEGFSAAY